MNEDEDIPLLEDLVRPGIDNSPAAETPAPEPETIEAETVNEPEEVIIDDEIRRILHRHMDAAYAEIIRLVEQQKKSDDKDQAD